MAKGRRRRSPFKNPSRVQQRSSPGPRLNRFRPRLELLEDRSVPALFAVNTLADTLAANLVTGEDAFGNISLRSALMAANSQSGTHVINLPAGTYTLTQSGSGENAAASGDLDITGNVVIAGAGAASTIIDGNNLDRVFEILGGASANLIKVTIRNGFASGPGGGIANAGELSLSLVALVDNVSRGSNGGASFSSPGAGGTVNGLGGGIYNSGTLDISQTTIAGNLAQGGNGGSHTSFGLGGGGGGLGAGGGLYNDGGSVLITASTFSTNTASGGNGGNGGPGGSVQGNGGGGGGDGGDGGAAPGGSGLSGAYGGGGGGGASGAAFNNGGNGAAGGFGGGGGGGGNANYLLVPGSGGAAGFGAGDGGFGGNPPPPPPNFIGGGGGGGGGGLGAGGAIFQNGGTLLIRYSTISGNDANGGGGGFVEGGFGGANGGDGGDGLGGGIFAHSGTLELRNVTVADNQTQAGAGGGLYGSASATATPGVAGATAGGGIYALSVTVQAGNALLANNSASSAPDFRGELASQGNNLIENTSGASISGVLAGNITGQDPALGGLADNGGPTQTHALSEGRLAVNAGSDALATQSVDQRGAARIGVVDIGAFEAPSDNPEFTLLEVTPQPQNEGNAVTLFGTIADSELEETRTLFIDWGDGSPVETIFIGTELAFSVAHVYGDDRSPESSEQSEGGSGYFIALSIEDSGGSTGFGSAFASIDNVAPVLSVPDEVSVGIGDGFIITGSIIDPGTDEWTVTVNFGDGTSPVTLAANADGTFQVSHAYSVEDTCTVTYVVNDGDGGVGGGQTTVYVLPDTPVSVDTSDTVNGVATATIPGVITGTLIQTDPARRIATILVALLPNTVAEESTSPIEATPDNVNTAILRTYDVRVINASAADLVVVTFRVDSPSGVQPLLEWLDPATNMRRLVQGSQLFPGSILVTRIPGTNVFEFTIIFDQTSSPTVRQLFGTVFTFSGPATPAPASVPDLGNLLTVPPPPLVVSTSPSLPAPGLPAPSFLSASESRLTVSSSTTLTPSTGGSSEEEQHNETVARVLRLMNDIHAASWAASDAAPVDVQPAEPQQNPAAGANPGAASGQNQNPPPEGGAPQGAPPEVEALDQLFHEWSAHDGNDSMHTDWLALDAPFASMTWQPVSMPADAGAEPANLLRLMWAIAPLTLGVLTTAADRRASKGKFRSRFARATPTGDAEARSQN